MDQILHYIALDGVGGVEILFHELLKQLPQPTADHRLALYSDNVHPFFKKTISEKIASAHRLKYCGLVKLPKKPFMIRQWNNLRILNLVNPDIIVFWNSINKDDYLKPEAYHRNCKLIFYDHGTSWYREIAYENSQLFLSKIDLTLCCSFASKRMLELYHHHDGEKSVIYNPLRPSFLDDAPPEKRLASHRPLRLGIVGRFVHIKGISLAIHTVAVLKARGIDAELFIAGTGKYGSAYKKLVKQLDIQNKVHFLGLVEDMAKFFSDIDIFVCPSLREPFGIVAVEAMGKGCPVVCAHVDGLPEVVSHERTGLCLMPTLPPNAYAKLGGGINGLPEFVYDPDSDAIAPPKAVDPKDIADAVERIVVSPEGFRAMSKACIEETNRRFGFETYVNQLSSVLAGI